MDGYDTGRVWHRGWWVVPMDIAVVAVVIIIVIIVIVVGAGFV